MQHDFCMRAAARAIYDAVYPTDDLAPVRFEAAEERRTVQYRRAIEAAQLARLYLLADDASQLPLI